ncbi:MAG: PLP-dependent aminotransferase family protein [Anaerolineales bacterium]|uniref:PLP-dependent aminotransferase family protein n=1 Tax=Candidatus Desulfolinea nitratireducens TaxID=2841698 RepID=A0A8J6NHW9_9CHLR|nr:PLP-dependent aminotransferase family protein [Candidatus Desulfolinea nitratireducens]MBL6960724.1 PLP-dependent aminotransferase family protein [Anaerolineales bacterium]
METSWDDRYAYRMKSMESSFIREILKLTQQPDVISFAGGLPAPKIFPVKEFQEAAYRTLEENSEKALQYGTTEGYLPLREMIAKRSARYGLKVRAENISITSGSQQALDLVGRLFIDRGDKIIVENPTYLGATQAWNAYGADYLPVSMDEEGMITSELEKALHKGAKFIYVLPNFQNPSGVTLSLKRRKELVALADRYRTPIIEDDPYGQIRFEGEHIPPVAVVDSEYRGQNGGSYDGNVIYLSTFSKLLAPGLRIAWAIGAESVMRRLVQAKQGADLHTSSFNQIAVYEVSQNDFLDKHVAVIRATYKERRDAMLEAMDELFPVEVKWTHPEGGMFLFVTLPEGMDAMKLFDKAVEKKVAYVPGSVFHPLGGGENTMRMNFSFPDPDTIREGIARLGKLLKEEIYAKQDFPV